MFRYRKFNLNLDKEILYPEDRQKILLVKEFTKYFPRFVYRISEKPASPCEPELRSTRGTSFFLGSADSCGDRNRKDDNFNRDFGFLLRPLRYSCIRITGTVNRLDSGVILDTSCLCKRTGGEAPADLERNVGKRADTKL